MNEQLKARQQEALDHVKSRVSSTQDGADSAEGLVASAQGE